MAGVSVGEGADNPVAINLTAMVDIIFCLCVFFMCSLHFKQLEGKFDTWLPKGKGNDGALTSENALQEIRVALQWDPASETVTRLLGTRRVPSDDELQSLIKAQYDDAVRLNRNDMPVTIDAEAAVPMDDVVKVVNICKRNKIENIEFALGAPPPVSGLQK
jgi:biopolymer transport protein ExbD